MNLSMNGNGTVSSSVSVSDVETQWKEYINPPPPCITPIPEVGIRNTQSVAPAPDGHDEGDDYLAADQGNLYDPPLGGNIDANSIGFVGSPLAEVMFTINESLAHIIRRNSGMLVCWYVAGYI